MCYIEINKKEKYFFYYRIVAKSYIQFFIVSRKMYKNEKLIILLITQTILMFVPKYREIVINSVFHRVLIANE